VGAPGKGRAQVPPLRSNDSAASPACYCDRVKIAVAAVLLFVTAGFLGMAAWDACEDAGEDCGPGCHLACLDGCATVVVPLLGAPGMAHLVPVDGVARAGDDRPLSLAIQPELGPPRA